MIADAVTALLIALDPSAADGYRQRRDALQQRLRTQQQQINAQLQPLRDQRYIVFHDAYQYFEHAFALQPAGAVTVNPEQRPGARRLRAIRDHIRTSGVRAVFSEPQFPSRLATLLIEDTGVRHATLDPLGAALTPGPDLYPLLLQQLADALHHGLTPLNPTE